MESKISSSAATCNSEMKISSGYSFLKESFTYWKVKRFGVGRESSWTLFLIIRFISLIGKAASLNF